MDKSQSSTGTLLSPNLDRKVSTRPRIDVSNAFVTWIDKERDRQGAGKQKQPDRGKARSLDRARTGDIPGIATSLRALADSWESKKPSGASNELIESTQELIAQIVEGLVRHKLSACRTGDWRCSLTTIAEGSAFLNNRLAGVFKEHVNGPNFLGEERQLPPVPQRLEFVRTLNAAASRLSLQIDHPDVPSTDGSPYFSAAGRQYALAIVAPHGRGRSHAPQYLAGVKGKEALPDLDFVPREASPSKSR